MINYLLIEDDSKREIHPEEYFNAVKERKKTITDEALVKLYDNCIELINKYMITGQTRGLRKILFCIDSIEREREFEEKRINFRLNKRFRIPYYDIIYSQEEEAKYQKPLDNIFLWD